MSNRYTPEGLREAQNLTLDQKIREAISVIGQAFEYGQRPGIAFSGGKDSTVLLDLIRRNYPQHNDIPVLLGNTGVMFPETRRFVRKLTRVHNLNLHEGYPPKLDEWEFTYEAHRIMLADVIKHGKTDKILTPDKHLRSLVRLEKAADQDLVQRLRDQGLVWRAGTRKGYWWCVDQYGWPLLGKNWSKNTSRRIRVDTMLHFKAEVAQEEYYQAIRHTKVSQACCSYLKKRPIKHIEKQLGIDLSFRGLMAEESHQRALSYLTRGALFQGGPRTYLRGEPYFLCSPMSIWTTEDVWAYIDRYDLSYSPLYDLTYTGPDGETKSVSRSGCMFCATDLHYRDNHMRSLRQTHPKAWRVAMTRGMADEIRKLQCAFRDDSLPTTNKHFSTSELLQFNPSAFDRVKHWTTPTFKAT